MSNARLSEKEIQARDRELVIKSNDGLRALMQFRFEQTIGTENGYSFRAYAKIIGVNESVVRKSANGYALLMRWEAAHAGRAHSPLDAYMLGDQSQAEQAAVIATADVVNMTPAEVRKQSSGSRKARPDVKVAATAARAAVNEAIQRGADEDEQRRRAEEAAKKAVREHKLTEARESAQVLKDVPEMKPEPYEPVSDLGKVAEILRFKVLTGLKGNADLSLEPADVDAARRMVQIVMRYAEAIQDYLENDRAMDAGLEQLLREGA